MSETWISKIENLIVQIATPFNSGTGFFIPQYKIIITNEHVIRENKSVVIEGRIIERQRANVIYIDDYKDIAFLQYENSQLPCEDLSIFKDAIKVGSSVIALGHPFGLKFTATRGIISSLDYNLGSLNYLQHDAALNPGNSGGPLFTSDGKLLGLNTFIVKEGQNIGLALPSSEILDSIEKYQPNFPHKAICCGSCRTLLLEDLNSSSHCNSCGSNVAFIRDCEDYEPTGICKKIESVIESLGYDIMISRKGTGNWEINKGSATIHITYHEKSGFLISDATLCYLNNKDIDKVYVYLLKQNYHIKGMTFSLRDNQIVISSMIYDQQLHFETCKKAIERLIKNADLYDNILSNQFGLEMVNEY
ncbi:MAG: hypothetical protein RLZZ546_2470 [Bacteroidota bacterium]|jgi:serine protease Do